MCCELLPASLAHQAQGQHLLFFVDHVTGVVAFLQLQVCPHEFAWIHFADAACVGFW